MLDSAHYYVEDDAVLRSPLLQPVFVKPTPSPTPPPDIAQIVTATPKPQSLTSPSSRRQGKSNRQKTRSTQADWVLIREMAPYRPDIAQQASRRALNPSSEDDDDDDDDDDMEGQSPGTASRAQSADPQQAAGRAPNSSDEPNATVKHRDSVLEEDILRAGGMLANARVMHASTASPLPSTNAGRTDTRDAALNVSALSTQLAASLSPPSQHQGTATNGMLAGLPSTASPSLRQLTIPQLRGPPTDTLPALQAPSPARDGAAASPIHQHSLPSFRHIDNIARSATSDQEISRANGFNHRQSISSVGQSPTSIVRQLSISSHSPATPYSLSASSPMSANSELHRGDIFLRSGGGGVFGADARRPSQATSENGPYPSGLHSASTSESYQSSEGLSPGTDQIPLEGRPRLMSLDGALASRVLPPPINSGIQHIPSQGSGSFKCDYPSCNAAPFQTQYLLNSHTNVHSSNRPHYCPVKECPRGEGGKGFKRKNEMIRHGLVHQSPGYVCPFCPDREHKYPRPDNLQRHVRVHHVDKDKDDAQLRDVLAQRPEGGSRGRRRRMSSL